jgi:hypothetical protein
LIYDLRTGLWTKEDKTVNFLDSWELYSGFTWNDLINYITGTGTDPAVWSAVQTRTWANFTSSQTRLMFGGTDGYVKYASGESTVDAYRVEPIMNFGDRDRCDLLLEVWFSLAETGSFLIDLYHRSGDTTGELENQAWTSIGTINCDNPDYAVAYVNQNAKLHQIKWGTDAANEKFNVNEIVFKYVPEGQY